MRARIAGIPGASPGLDAAGGLGHARIRRRRRPDLTAHQSAYCFAAIEITSGLGSLFAGRAMRLGDPQRTMRPIPATSHYQLTAIELQLGVPCGPVHQSNPAFGFSLLVRTADGTIAGSADRAGPEITPRPPSLGNVEQQTFFGQASARENKDAAQSSAAFPAPTGAPAIDGKEHVPQSGGGLTSKAPTDTPSAPANAPVPAPSSPAATALAPSYSG